MTPPSPSFEFERTAKRLVYLSLCLSIVMATGTSPWFGLSLFGWLACGLFLLFLEHDSRRCVSHHVELVRQNTEREARINAVIADLAIGYDPTSASNTSLRRFSHVKQRTPCIFAKASRLWGSPEWQADLSLEDNVRRACPALVRMVARSQAQLDAYRLEGDELVRDRQAKNVGRRRIDFDGFVLEIRGRKKYHRDLATFGRTVRRVLDTLSHYDPASRTDGTPHTGFDRNVVPRGCMRDRARIASTGWHFRFAGDSIFVTTFAPLYPKAHARHMYSTDSETEDEESCFILLQPEISFLLHNIGSDTPRSATQWHNPATDRDKIRVAFRDRGQAYHIPDTVRYPASRHLVPAVNPEDPNVQWWLDDEVPEKVFEKHTPIDNIPETIEAGEHDEIEDDGFIVTS